MNLAQYEITISRQSWKGYRAIVRGDGNDLASALDNASKGIGSVFRPRDGKRAELLNIVIERPDGTRFVIPPTALKISETPEELEAFKDTK
jgi:hypothetical protein